MDEIIAVMTEQQARQITEEIRKTGNSLRSLLNEADSGKAWAVLGYDTMNSYILNEFPEFSKGALYRELQAARTESLLEVPIGTYRESTIRPLARNEFINNPTELNSVWEQVVATAPEGKITAAHVQAVVDEVKRPVSYHVSDDSYEWYTPAEYIEAARGVMGKITLDPASSIEAQKTVKADYFYTKEDDGLLQDWTGNVWLNPPYNMPLIEQFIDKVISDYKNENIDSAIVLTNNSTDTGWFHKLIGYPVCFTKGRIKFYSGAESLATRQGQAIFYLGDDTELFARIFSAFGAVLVRYDNK